MGYGSLVSLVFHNLPSLYPSSFRRNDFSYLYILDIEKNRAHCTTRMGLCLPINNGC